jgi:fused signal recognition particle receptor
MSWLERLTGGFKKTADRLGENLSGLVKEQALDTATLDDIEEALIASDPRPRGVQARSARASQRRRYEQLDERGLRTDPRRRDRKDPRAGGQATRRLGLSRVRM